MHQMVGMLPPAASMPSPTCTTSTRAIAPSKAARNRPLRSIENSAPMATNDSTTAGR
ncbi:hypothetical protein D3C71_1924390 [compost metagenome]